MKCTNCNKEFEGLTCSCGYCPDCIKIKHVGKVGDNQIMSLYRSIKDVINIPTREILYRQFIQRYFPEAYEVIK